MVTVTYSDREGRVTHGRIWRDVGRLISSDEPLLSCLLRYKRRGHDLSSVDSSSLLEWALICDNYVWYVT